MQRERGAAFSGSLLLLLLLFPVVSEMVGCSSASGIAPVDAADAQTTGGPDAANDSNDSNDLNCDPSLTYATFGMNFLDTFCNRCHAWTQQGAQLARDAIAGAAGTATAMPPSAPFPTRDQRMQLVQWISCGEP